MMNSGQAYVTDCHWSMYTEIEWCKFTANNGFMIIKLVITALSFKIKAIALAAKAK